MSTSSDKYLYVIFAIMALAVLLLNARLFIAIAFAAVQFFSSRLVHWLRLNVIPLVNFDYEISNLLLIAAALWFGPGYAFLIIALLSAVHFLHGDVLDARGTIDFIVRASVLVAALMPLQDAPLSLVPWAILASKIAGILFRKLFFGARIISIMTIKETFTSMAYFAFFSLFGQNI